MYLIKSPDGRIRLFQNSPVLTDAVDKIIDGFDYDAYGRRVPVYTNVGANYKVYADSILDEDDIMYLGVAVDGGVLAEWVMEKLKDGQIVKFDL